MDKKFLDSIAGEESRIVAVEHEKRDRAPRFIEERNSRPRSEAELAGDRTPRRTVLAGHPRMSDDNLGASPGPAAGAASRRTICIDMNLGDLPLFHRFVVSSPEPKGCLDLELPRAVRTEKHSREQSFDRAHCLEGSANEIGEIRRAAETAIDLRDRCSEALPNGAVALGLLANIEQDTLVQGAFDACGAFDRQRGETFGDLLFDD